MWLRHDLKNKNRIAKICLIRYISPSGEASLSVRHISGPNVDITVVPDTPKKTKSNTLRRAQMCFMPGRQSVSYTNFSRQENGSLLRFVNHVEPKFLLQNDTAKLIPH